MITKIQEDMKAAMKSGDKLAVGTLRMILADLHNKEIEKKEELNEADIIEVLQRGIKMRKEAVELYQKGGREDLAQKELKEIEIIKSYLPKPLSPKEVEKKVEEVIAELGVSQKKEMGVVMKEMMSRFLGRVEGAQVKEIVLKKLE